MINRNIIEHIFKVPDWINHKYMDNMILIADVDDSNGPSVDVVIYKNGDYGIYEEFSEIIDGKIAGGWKTNNLGLETDYQGVVVYTGEVFDEPEWHIVTWDYGETTDDIKIKDENKGWFTIGKSTNYKLVHDND